MAPMRTNMQTRSLDSRSKAPSISPSISIANAAQFRSGVVPYFQGIQADLQDIGQGTPLFSVGVYGSGGRLCIPEADGACP